MFGSNTVKPVKLLPDAPGYARSPRQQDRRPPPINMTGVSSGSPAGWAAPSRCHWPGSGRARGRAIARWLRDQSLIAHAPMEIDQRSRLDRPAKLLELLSEHRGAALPNQIRSRRIASSHRPAHSSGQAGAWAANGHATVAAPPNSVMNSRRLIRSPRRRLRAASLVTSIPDRAAFWVSYRPGASRISNWWQSGQRICEPFHIRQER